MIELINVSKYYPTDFGRHYLFRNVSLQLPLDMSVGVIGPNGAGKSTFLRLLGGADMPNEGRITRTGRISPPMGLTPGVQRTLTGSENVRFACRIYGMTRDEIQKTIARVEEMADIGKFFDMPVGTYSAGMKQRLAFAISMSMHYDYYLFDEIGAGGDRKFQAMAKKLVQERLATSKFIITSHRVDELINLCQAGILIMDGTLTYYDDIRDALTAYGETADIGLELDKPAKEPRRKNRQAGSATSGNKAATSPAGDRSAQALERLAHRQARRAGREKGQPTAISPLSTFVPPEGSDQPVLYSGAEANQATIAKGDDRSDDGKGAGIALRERRRERERDETVAVDDPSRDAIQLTGTVLDTSMIAAIRRAQSQAESKSARAQRLLLRTLDLTATETPSPILEEARHLAAAAQRQAAAAATSARSLLEGLGRPGPDIPATGQAAEAVPPSRRTSNSRKRDGTPRHERRIRRGDAARVNGLGETQP